MKYEVEEKKRKTDLTKLEYTIIVFLIVAILGWTGSTILSNQSKIALNKSEIELLKTKQENHEKSAQLKWKIHTESTQQVETLKTQTVQLQITQIQEDISEIKSTLHDMDRRTK